MTKNPELKVVEKGTTALLDCGATGSPTPNIYWVKDAKRLAPNPRYAVVQGGKNRGEWEVVYNGWMNSQFDLKDQIDQVIM